MNHASERGVPSSTGPSDGWLDRARMPFAEALRLCRAGQLHEAHAICQDILTQAPNDVDALHLTGLVLSQVGALKAGIDNLRRATSLAGDIPVLHFNLAEALGAVGHLDQASSHYARALELAPEFADAAAHLGSTLLRQNRVTEAVGVLRQAIVLDPTIAAPHDHLGSALQSLGQPGAAEAEFRCALAIDPGSAATHYNLGNALSTLGHHEEALASFDAALRLKPDLAAALHNRGTSLFQLGRWEQALSSFDRALVLAPHDANALVNRGTALLQLGRLEAALANYDEALGLRPDSTTAHYSRGNALLALQRHDAALAEYDRALALDPGNIMALGNRAAVLLALRRHVEAVETCERALALKADDEAALANRGNALIEIRRFSEAAQDFARLVAVAPDYPYARGNNLYAQLMGCDWTDYTAQVERIAAGVTAGEPVSHPFMFLALQQPTASQTACAALYTRDKHPASPTPVWRGEHYVHGRIRLAYLSGDFGSHPVMHSIAELLEGHDRSRVETLGISFGPIGDDAFSRRLRRSFERFVDVRGQSDREVAAMLRRDEIDIAVDLMGYTTGSRPGIFAHRGAPIQVSYLGYLGSMGADYIDYIIADHIVLPEDEQRFYSEKVVHLPHSFLPNDTTRSVAGPPPARRDVGLPQNGFVFCSFHNRYKITPQVFDTWMRLLREVDGSVLWLLEGDAAATRNQRNFAAQRGVAPERLVFASHVTAEDHLARLGLSDLFLDTSPYNAGATAGDALWVGLPVVTCLGSTFVGRMAASQLHAAGLPELVTGDLIEYEVLALELASKPERLAVVKAKLARARGSAPLFDPDCFRRHIEAAYKIMWKRQQRGEPPAGFAVPESWRSRRHFIGRWIS